MHAIVSAQHASHLIPYLVSQHHSIRYIRPTGHDCGSVTTSFTIIPSCDNELTAMSDLFYPKKIIGNKYDIAIVGYIPKHHHSISHTPGESTGSVYVVKPPSATPVFKTKIPTHYVLHLQRLLWRHRLFVELYIRFHKSHKRLNHKAIGFFQCMLIMMDTVIEQLLIGFSRPGMTLNANNRIPNFDVYLVTLFVVGRHDPESVYFWRRYPGNWNYDLERINPDDLGEFH